MAQFNIHVEYKNSRGAAFYDFVQPAFSREAALLGAETRIQENFGNASKIRWRGAVAFVNCRPAEEISS